MMGKKKKPRKTKKTKKTRPKKKQGGAVRWEPEPFQPPLSGQVLGAIVKTLGLRNISQAGSGLKGNTAVRYFKGERIKDDSRLEVLLHFAQALLDAGFFEVFQVELMTTESRTFTERLALWFDFLAVQWDRLAASMRSFSCPINIHKIAPLPYLRLCVLDLAIRSAAALLIKGNTPDEEPPLWVLKEGRGALLKELQKRSGKTRDDLIVFLEMNENTIDGWLDGQHRPADDNLQWISSRFGELLGEDPDRLLRELRRHYALNDLIQSLAGHMREKDLRSLATAYIRFAKAFHNELKSDLDSFLILRYEEADLPEIFFLGGQAPKAGTLVEEVWKRETDSIWAKDLTFVCGDWLLRLQEVAQRMTLHPRELEQIKKKKFNVPKEQLMDFVADIALNIDASNAPWTPAMVEESKDMKWFRVSGSSETKALNRYDQAREREAHGDFEAAADHMRRAVELVPDNATYRYLYGSYLGELCKRRRGEEQEELLRQAIHECEIAAQLPEGTGVAPDKPWVEPGIILCNIGRKHEARKYLENAEKRIGMTPWLALKLGTVRYFLRDFMGAWECFQVALKEFPEDAKTLERAGHSCFELSLKREGVNLFKRANHLGESEFYNYWKKGRFKRK